MSGIALFDAAVVVALILLAILWVAFRGGALNRPRSVHLRCPRTDVEADCTLVQDVRVGQYRDILFCSALPDPYEIACDQECRRLLNLGHPPESVHRA